MDSEIEEAGGAIVFENDLFYFGCPSYKYNLKDHQWTKIEVPVIILHVLLLKKIQIISLPGYYGRTACSKSHEKV